MTENKSLNQKITELDEKTDWFYSDEFKIEEAPEKFKEAIALAEDTKKDLKELKNEIEVLAEDFSK